MSYGFTVIIHYVNDELIQLDYVHRIYESCNKIYFFIKDTDIRSYSRNYINKIEIRNI